MASHSRKKRQKQYSPGELNRLVDDLIHPLIKQKPELVILDAVLHGLVEHDPSETAVKFIRYSLPEIIEKFMKSN